MKRIGWWAWLAWVPAWAGEMPEKAAAYHEALVKRPESAVLFERFRDAWLEEQAGTDLDRELQARADAGEAGAWAILGRARALAGREEEALAAYESARRQSPAAWLDLEIARLRMAARDFAAAEKDALAVPEGDPKRADALKLAGLACLRAERVDDALARWQMAVATSPGDKGLLEDLVELTRREGRNDLALEFCGKWRDATEDAYGKALATLRRSELLLAGQRFDEAVSELAAVIEVSADGSWLEREAVARAEQAHARRGDTTRWAAWITGQADAHPSRLGLRRAQAQALSAAGRTDEALEVLAEVAKRTPGDHGARWQRVELLDRALRAQAAFEECAALAREDPSEAAGLRLAELAFRVEKPAEVKRALDGVLAAADPARRVSLAALYARYGQPEVSERAWRAELQGEHSGQALRELARHLQRAGRDSEAADVWKQLGARDHAADRIEAAQMLAGAGDFKSARAILDDGRARFSKEPGYEAARAELAMLEGNPAGARAIHLALARAATRPDEMDAAVKGWMRAAKHSEDPLAELGAERADRCLRAAWLADAGKPLPEPQPGDELERSLRLTLLREHGRWKDVVALMESAPGERGPLFLSDLAEAKSAAGDLAGALAAARECRERATDQPSVWLREADILDRFAKRDEAIRLLRRASARFEDNEDVARRLLSLLEKSADPDAAVEWAWKRHDRAPDERVRYGWLREIVRISREGTRLADLKERFEERARRDPASPSPWLALAELARAQGDSREELGCLRKAAANAPRDPAVISALASLEERNGESARALARYAELARLTPTPETARSLAQAKIRLGEIESGVRDLETLAGEKGINLRELEQSAGNLSGRGCVEEAIRLLSAVEPSRRDARLSYQLGCLLEKDGREPEAVDAFARVLAEPDDPAEAKSSDEMGRYAGRQDLILSQLIRHLGTAENLNPGMLGGMEMPRSLAAAKAEARGRIVRIAVRLGGDAWTRARAAIPELRTGGIDHWREVARHQQSATSSSGYGSNWWEFFLAHPENPLALEMLMENPHAGPVKPEVAEALLKRDPPLPLRLRMELRLNTPNPPPDQVEFLESITAAEWQDEKLAGRALAIVERLLLRTPADAEEKRARDAGLARSLAVLGKIPFRGNDARRWGELQAGHAILTGDADTFVARVNEVPPQILTSGYSDVIGLFGTSVQSFHRWREKAGDAAADALIERIQSPAGKCLYASYQKPERRLAMVDRELAALPADTPRESRRALIYVRWDIQRRLPAANDRWLAELRKMANEDPDPRVALDALNRISSMGSGRTQPADQQRMRELLARLAQSPEEDDRKLAAMFSHDSAPRPAPPATRWGGGSPSSYQGSYQNASSVRPLLEMEDKQQAGREAARVLEAAARTSESNPSSLDTFVKSLKDAGLLDAALSRIHLPAGAGLCRRVAMLRLMDACGRPERAEEILTRLAAERPWETLWTVELALRSFDAEQRQSLWDKARRVLDGRFDVPSLRGFALLDSVAERPGFSEVLLESLMPRYRGANGVLLGRLPYLADWSSRAKGGRDWLAAVTVALAKGGRGGLDRSLDPNAEQDPRTRCFHRFLDLALEDPATAEIAFRTYASVAGKDQPGKLAELARRAVLAGAWVAGSVPRTVSLNRFGFDEAFGASSLETLVRCAETLGDDAVFSADFRARLNEVDPETSAWLDKLLAARKVADLPDLAVDPKKVSSPAGYTRFQASLIRAARLPGRDAWLDESFRKLASHGFSRGNMTDLIRRSLLDASKSGTLKKRVLTLLEAAAGPRKSWTAKSDQEQHLPTAAESIMGAAEQTDAATLHAVIGIFAGERVPVQSSSNTFNRLGMWWRDQLPPAGTATFDGLLGKQPAAAFTLGFWQYSGGANERKLLWRWGLPQVLAAAATPQRDKELMQLKDKPDLNFLDAMQVMRVTQDKSARRQALVSALPKIAKLPVEMRESVIDALTQGMGRGDVKGLPEAASSRLLARLEMERKRRVAQARQEFAQLQSAPGGLAGQGQRLGSILARAADDAEFSAEILAAWRPVAEADKSGAAMEAFAYGLASQSGSDPQASLACLRLLDGLWKGAPPVARKNSQSGDPFQYFRNSLNRMMNEPEIWLQLAALSPGVQARFWLVAMSSYDNANLTKDPKLLASLREAARGGEITRAALECRIQSAAVRGNSSARMESSGFLDFARALKKAGVPPESIAPFWCDMFGQLSRMDHPERIIAETPRVLEGLKTFPNDGSGGVFQGLLAYLNRVQSEMRRASGGADETTNPPLPHMDEVVALLKWAFAMPPNPERSYLDLGSMSSVVLSTGDAGLLEAWIRYSGRALVGDSKLILALLEKDRVAEAVSLAPEPGGRLNSRAVLRFTPQIEKLAAKLEADPSPRALRLRAEISLRPDPYRDELPAENLDARRKRLVADFERIRAGLEVTDRAALCKSLDLEGNALLEHIPALDEFADGKALEDFRRNLTTGEGPTLLGGLFVPAACSRVHAGDYAPLTRLAEMVSTLPKGRRHESRIKGSLSQVLSCLVVHADRHDAALPKPAAEIALSLARTLSGSRDMDVKSSAFLLIHLASNDVGSLAANLKECGLDPRMRVFLNHSSVIIVYHTASKHLLRLAVLHAVASEVLFQAFLSPRDMRNPVEEVVPLLAEEKVRARISPAVFLSIFRHAGPMPAGNIEHLELFAKERGKDFNENERAELDMLMDRWRRMSPAGRMETDALRRRAIEEEIRRRRFRGDE